MSDVAGRMAHIAPFHVMKLLARAKKLEAQGKSIVHMEIGEPDFKTPKTIVDAGIAALKQGLTHYTPAIGLPELRQAIAAYYASQFNVDIEANNIVVTPGASGALQLVCGVLINPGDEVVVTDPGYPCNRHFVQLMGGVPTFVNLEESENYVVSLAVIEKQWTKKSKAVLLASPSNPTGMIIPISELDKIATFLKQNNAYLILDEIYLGLVYDKNAATFAGRHDNVFIINSFSKYFSMTGWRLGWLVAPSTFIEAIDKLAQNIFLAPTTSSQHAALAAFSSESIEVLESYRDSFKERRDYLFNALNATGFTVVSKPHGAFYLYADCSQFHNNSFEFAHNLLEQAGVAITPGIDFGRYKAAQYVRFAYTTSISQLELGVTRLSKYLSEN